MRLALAAPVNAAVLARASGSRISLALIGRLLLCCTMLILACAASAGGIKRDIQGMALGMSPAQVKSATNRKCFDNGYGHSFICVDANKVGHKDYDGTQMEVLFTKAIQRPTAYRVVLEFCSGADLGSVVKETRDGFGFTGEAHMTTRGPTSMRFDPASNTTVTVEAVASCLDHAGQIRFYVSITDDPLFTADRKASPDTPAPGAAVPKL